MLVYGKNVLKETDPKKIKRVYINRNSKDNSILEYLKLNKIKFNLVDIQRLNQMCNGVHQGIVIDIDDYSYFNLDTCLEEELVVILDHIEDPHNFGAIIRTCEAAGISSIIIPKDRSVRVNDTVMKTSTGSLNHVKIIQVTNINQTLNVLKDNNFFIYAADMSGKDYKTIDYADKKVLIIGNEGKGISKLVLDNADEIITIPMKGTINSLNASVATAIIIFNIM